MDAKVGDENTLRVVEDERAQPGSANSGGVARSHRPRPQPFESLRVFALFLPVGCVARELSRGGDPSTLDRISRESLWAEQSITPTSRSNVERTLGHPVSIAQFSLLRSTARGLGLEAIGPAHDAHAYRPGGLAEASPIGSRNRALRFASRLLWGEH